VETKTALPNIGNPATNALAVVGVTTLEQVCEWHEKDMLKLHGVGPKAIRILKEALAEKGWSFKS
jgi:predicted flap endonuclease-1-like 5' DNA nuclease